MSLLSGDEPGVRLAISTAIRTRTPQAASADRLQTVIVPVTLDRIVSGALVVARRVPVDDPAGVRGQLELIGFWLTNAIEAHLQSPPAAQGDLDRLSALCRLLDDVSGRQIRSRHRRHVHRDAGGVARPRGVRLRRSHAQRDSSATWRCPAPTRRSRPR